jgi:prevent-host-death family protein
VRTVTARELNHQTGRVLEQVTATGEPVAVTYRGQTRWRIIPVGDADRPLDRLIRAGQATQPAYDLPLPPGPAVTRSGLTVDELIAQTEADH